jgi:glycosyltransferase involved in cell wall biosynthesis
MNINAIRQSPNLTFVPPGREASSDAILLHFGAASKLVEAQRRLPVPALGIPVVGFWVVESPKMNPSMVEFSQGLAQIWTPSESSKNAIVDSGVKVPVKVIPHPVLPPTAGRPSREGEPFTILTCGSAPVVRKGYDLAFAAFQAAFPVSEYPEVRWILKLRGIPADRLEVITEMTSKDSRIILSVADVPDMTEVYYGADVYMQCHKAGGFELHCAEAAAHGLPVLATDVGGVKDYLPQSARITPAGFVKNEAWDPLNQVGNWAVPDVVAVGSALRTLYRDASARVKLADECRTMVTAHCNPSRIAALMAEALVGLPPRTAVDPRLAQIHKIEKNRLDMAARIDRAGKIPNSIEVVEPGLEVVGGGIIAQAVVGILSHRRSGTHHLGETVRRAWERPWAKSHAFPSTRNRRLSWVYIVRNPIDTLFSTFEWFRSTGGASNSIISAEVDKCTFDQFLKGRAGKLLGYLAHREGRRDNCVCNRGMFFDPIQHWADHVREALDEKMTVVTHESLMSDPEAIGEILAKKIGRPPVNPVVMIEEKVGLKPSREKDIGYALSKWSPSSLTLLNVALTDTKWGDPLLSKLGFSSLEDWLKNP